MDTTVAAVSLLYFIISFGPWNNRSAIEITFSSPRVWIPPSDRPSHGIFCLAGHSWVAPASSLICPSYSGLTRRIPAEGISEAFFKIFVNLEDISSVSQENTCWIKKKNVKGVQATNPRELFMSSNLPPSCLEDKNTIIATLQHDSYLRLIFFLFLHIFFSNCSCVQTHYPATLCTHMDLKVVVLPDARRQFSLHIRVNKVLDILSSPFHIFTFLYNVWARTEHPIKSGFDFALKEITILIFKRQSFTSFLPGVPLSPYIFLRAA